MRRRNHQATESGGRVPGMPCPVCRGRKPGGGFNGLCQRCVAQNLLLDPGLEDLDCPPFPGRAAGSGLGGIPERLGDYALEAAIGHGGMGVVYRARQCSLDRIVAVKLLLMGRFAGAGSIQRFLREAEAAARLRHPNIVSVHGIGEVEGLHYFSMDYVEGQSLSEQLRAGPLTPTRVATLGRTLAEAVDYAHRHGIVHRDLKPSNVLMDVVGQPHITDFGLAKRLDDLGDLTLTGELLGSPHYLSPEQAAGCHNAVGARSDIYALGAILYECLTGRVPFAAASVTEVLIQIRDAVPVSPRQLRLGLSKDLVAVVMKCLEKQPAKRYASAADLAADLGRYLQGEPTRARPVGASGRITRWVRRKPMHALAVALAGVTIIATSLASFRARRDHLEVEKVNRQMADTIYRGEWRGAENAVNEGRMADALVLFARLLRNRPADHGLATRLTSLLNRRAFVVPIGSPMPHDGPVTSVDLSGNCEAVLTASGDGTARLWRAEDGQLIRRFVDQEPLVQAFMGAEGRLILTVRDRGGGRLWRVRDGSVVREWVGEAGFRGLAAVDSARSLGALRTGPATIRLLDLTTGEDWGAPLNLEARASAVVFGGDGGNCLLTGTESGRLQLWRLADQKVQLMDSADLESPVTRLAMTPDGSRVLAGTREGVFFVFDARHLGQPLRRDDAAGMLQFIECSPDGSRAVISRFGEWPEMWNLTSLVKEGVFRRSDNEIALQAAWSPDGTGVLLGFRSGRVNLFDPVSREPVQEAFQHQGPIAGMRFHDGGQHVVTASQDWSARVWDIRARNEAPRRTKLPGRLGRELVMREGGPVAIVIRGQEAWLCNPREGAVLGSSFHHESEIRTAALARDGRKLATGTLGVWVWDLEGTGRRLGPLGSLEPVESVAWGPGGDWLISASHSGRICRWDASTGRRWSEELIVPAATGPLVISPDGRTFIVVCADALVRTYDTATFREKLAPLRHRGRIWTAEFSPDGKQLLTASVDRTVGLWDLSTGQPVGRPMRHDREALVACFSPDGRIIASGGEDQVVRLWETGTGRPLTSPLRHGSRVWVVTFSPDGQRLLTAADRGEVCVWDVCTGMPLTGVLNHSDTMLRAWFLPGSDDILTATHRDLVTTWQVDRVPAPAPPWLPDLAEALAGQRLASDGSLTPVPERTLQQFAGDLSALPLESPYRSWADRFAARYLNRSGLDQPPSGIRAAK